MGGKALKNIETRRLNADEYHALVPVVLEKIAAVVGRDRPLAVIQAYGAKPDFGDMDVLVASDNIPTDYKDRIAEAFASRDVHRNGNVTSLEFQSFQIDVIAIKAESFDFALSYFNWNDLGNLVGRVAHKMGCKYAFEGLYVPLRDGDHMFAEVTVTRDVDKALNFLGYDPLRFRAGFQTMEEIFRYTASTPYFDPAIYLLENRNATSRVRDAKRPTYNAFLKWLEDPAGLATFLPEKFQAQAWYEFPTEKATWLTSLRTEFPDFGDRMDAALAKKARYELARTMFNGERVTELTGLKGKELGELMRGLREAHEGPDALASWVLDVGQAGVDRAVMDALARAKPGARP